MSGLSRFVLLIPGNCSGRRETRRRIGARTFLSASGDLPRSADKNVRAPTRDLNSYEKGSTHVLLRFSFICQRLPGERRLFDEHGRLWDPLFCDPFAGRGGCWAWRRACSGTAEPREGIARSPSPRPSPPGEGEAPARATERIALCSGRFGTSGPRPGRIAPRTAISGWRRSLGE